MSQRVLIWGLIIDVSKGGGGEGLGDYLFIIFTFTCQHEQPVVCVLAD